MTPRQLRQPLREVPVGRRDSALTAGEATAQAQRAEAAQVLLPVGAAILKRARQQARHGRILEVLCGGGQPGLSLALQRRGRQQQRAAKGALAAGVAAVVAWEENAYVPPEDVRNRQGEPMTVPRIQFSWHKFKDWDDETTWDKLRFRLGDIRFKVLPQLRLPADAAGRLQTAGGTWFTPEQGLFLFLHKMNTNWTYRELAHSGFHSGADTTLNEIFLTMGYHLHDLHKHRVTLEHNKGLFATARRLIEQMTGETDFFGFVDCSQMQCARPSGDGSYGDQFFSGHKNLIHVKFQATMLPQGIVASWDGPFNGRQNDLNVLYSESAAAAAPRRGGAAGRGD